MDPVTLEKLSANAYRTLGLSGAAGQSAIEAAARKMRIWPDPSRVPPTEWDFPKLGPMRRSRSDIEQAVSILNQPASRLEHRLLWFAEQPPTAELHGLGNPVIERHSLALANLHAAWIASGPSDEGSSWSPVIRQWMNVFGSPGFADWQRDLEQQGRFDKQASDGEIDAMIAAVPAAISAGLVRPALNALDQGRLDAVTAIASALGQFPPSPWGPDAAKDLLDRMEDLFNARCAEMDKDLRDNLRTNHQSPHGLYEANFEHSNRAARFYDNKVRPVMQSLVELCRSDSDRLVRVNTACADVLVLLALGWEWSGRMASAERQLQAALVPVLGTITELRVRRELQRVTPLADEERRLAAAARAGGWSASFNKPVVAQSLTKSSTPRVKQKQSWSGAFLILGIAICAFIMSSNSNSNSTPNDNGPAISPFPTIIVPPFKPSTDSIPPIPNLTDPASLPSAATVRKIPPLGDNFREP